MKDEQVLFAIAPEGQGDGVPLILLAITPEAWDYMKDSKTHNFDLTIVGVPVKITMFGVKDEEAFRKLVVGHNTRDMTHVDFNIKPKGKPS